MDQYRSRLKLSENFERHWSIRISGEIHVDQSLVHAFSWGNSYGSMVRSSKVCPYTDIGPWMALPSSWSLQEENLKKTLGLWWMAAAVTPLANLGLVSAGLGEVPFQQMAARCNPTSLAAVCGDAQQQACTHTIRQEKPWEPKAH